MERTQFVWINFTFGNLNRWNRYIYIGLIVSFSCNLFIFALHNWEMQSVSSYEKYDSLPAIDNKSNQIVYSII